MATTIEECIADFNGCIDPSKARLFTVRARMHFRQAIEQATSDLAGRLRAVERIRDEQDEVIVALQRLRRRRFDEEQGSGCQKHVLGAIDKFMAAETDAEEVKAIEDAIGKAVAEATADLQARLDSANESNQKLRNKLTALEQEVIQVRAERNENWIKAKDHRQALEEEKDRHKQALTEVLERENRGWRNSTAYAQQCEIHKGELAAEKATHRAAMELLRDKHIFDTKTATIAEGWKWQTKLDEEQARHQAELATLNRQHENTVNYWHNAVKAADAQLERERLRGEQALETERRNWEAYRSDEAERVRVATANEREACAQYLERLGEFTMAKELRHDREGFRPATANTGEQERIAKAVAEEREACAVIVDKEAARQRVHGGSLMADEMRARAKSPVADTQRPAREPHDVRGVRVVVVEGHPNEFMYLATPWRKV